MGHEVLLEGLNQSQRAAVLHEDGPLAVLAGPGTGKTKLIVHRIADLIVRRGAEPSSIVALTFTVKAAAQLRERLAGLLASLEERGVAVPVAAADAVGVHTYHGYGRRLTARFGDFLGLPLRHTLLDAAQQRRLVREVIVRDRLCTSVFGEGAAGAADRVLAALAQLGDLAIAPSEALARIDAWLDGPAVGAVGAAGKASVLLAREVVEAAQAVQAEQRRRGLLTYNDLLTLPIELLRTRELAASIVRQELRHAVVDEFQDVNAATIVLLSLLMPSASAGGASGGPDLCVVGDDDQAIYAFRGADDRAFERFSELWPGHAEVRLEENYRSHARVLAAASRVMALASSRYRPDKALVQAAGSPAAQLEGAGVEVIDGVRGADADAPVVAAWLLAAKAASPQHPWRSYAVIARGHTDLARIAEALRLENIPISVARGTSLADEPGAETLLDWCRTLNDPHDSASARPILRGDGLLLDGTAVLELEARYRRQLKLWRELGGDSDGVEHDEYEGRENEGGEAGGGVQDPGAYLPWACAQLAAGDAGVRMGAGVVASAARVAGLYRSMAARRASLRASELLYELALETDVVHAGMLPPKQRAKRLEGVVRLLRFARLRQERLSPPGDLTSFMAYFDELDPNKRGIDDSPGDRVDAEDAGGLEAGGEPVDAVTLITAHSAKGLEFDTVLVPRVEPGNGYPTSRKSESMRLGAGVLSVLVGASGIAGSEADAVVRARAEERRLFYVACTRAQRRLVVIGAMSQTAVKDVGKPGKPTSFLAELLTARGAGFVPRMLEDVLEARPGERSKVVEELTAAADGRKRTDERLSAVLRARAQVALALDAACAVAADVSTEAGTDARAHRGELEALLAEVQVRARHAAAAECVQKTGLIPAWADECSGAALRALVVPLARARAATGADADGDGDDAESGEEGLVTGAMRARWPVGPAMRTLSYTKVHDYLRCPACWFCKYAMGHDRGGGDRLNVGTLVHDVLAAFFVRLRDARESEQAEPGLAELLAMGRRAVLMQEGGVGSGGAARVAGEMLAQVSALLTSALQQHDPSAGLTGYIENSRMKRASIEVDGRQVPLECTFDRADHIDGPEGVGFRIIDYKTGRVTDELAMPARDDLQLGVYKLGLMADLGLDEVAGEARYVLLRATPEDRARWARRRDEIVEGAGKRRGAAPVVGPEFGTIRLADIDVAAVSEKIAGMVRGVLAGKFEPGSGCTDGPCALLKSRRLGA